jgi:hypothetical protein
MARIVREHDLGIVCDSFSPQAMAERLNALDPEEIEHFKRQSDRAASALSSQANLDKLDRIVRQLT